MNAIIAGQVRAAQTEAERVFDDNPRVNFNDGKIRFGLEYELKSSQEGAIVTLDLVDRSPVEGPSLDKVKQSSGPVHAAPSTESWGKPNRR